MRDLRQRGEGGQSIIELAIAMPMLAFVLIGALQLGLFFLADLHLGNVTRDAARWLSVHPDTTDATFRSAIVARLSGDLAASRLTITTNPACPSLSGGLCAGRTAGSDLRVTLTYDASPLAVASFVYRPPTQLSSTMHMRVEPH